ncbi:hypothetical protein P5673_033622 [Acropora cervicornis]|uniref:Uncharacterized protein n=1 Tax=Acropora cervicornis TaxID=6130 RepID=A0AAD9UR52_ACRCE|nr:hypothetical protein P5673_033622 [Acropora cervicornis]
MESVRVIFHQSSSTVVQPAPLKHVQVIRMTISLHFQPQKAMGQDVAMFMIFFLRRQGNQPVYLYCENKCFEDELYEWVPSDKLVASHSLTAC